MAKETKEMTVEELQKELARQKKLVATAEKAEAEARAEIDALTKKTDEEAASLPIPERVVLRVPRDKKKGDLFVAVNGENFLIQRGVSVEVPRYVAEVIQNSLTQDEKAELMMESLSGEAKELRQI